MPGLIFLENGPLKDRLKILKQNCRISAAEKVIKEIHESDACRKEMASKSCLERGS